MGFESFLGNPKAVSALREMLRSDRVPGALLFTGPEGVGKRTLALMLAKALNCERHKDNFCGECWHCRKSEEMVVAAREDLARRREMKDTQRRTEGLVYFDLQLIEPLTRFILTEQIRQLRNVAYARPFEFPRRVFIVDEAQTIHWQAADLLLKVLEEPPETTTFILVCPNAYELRPTIRSRCQRVQFLPVEPSLISQLLAEGKGLTKAQRELGVHVAAGSIGKAKAFDPDEFVRRRQPWLEFLEAITSAPPGSGTATDWKALFDSTKALTENREDFEGTLRIGYSLLRDLTEILVAGSDADVTNVDLLTQLKAWGARFRLSGIEKLKEGLDQAYRLQVRNVNQQLGLEALALDLITVSGASFR